MDENEKAVLRRRKSDIASKMDVSRDLLNDLSGRGLLSHDAIKDIEREKCKSAKASRVVDSLLAVNPTDGFNSFCAVLQDSSVQSSARLAHELDADLRLEKGDLRPRQELIDEAAVLVHRKFGPSKRFSESDKREVAELIAVKLQLSEEDWQREIDRTHAELDRLRKQLNDRDDKAQQVVGLLRDFASRHESQLTSHSHDLTTTQMLVRQMMEAGTDDGNLLPKLHQNLNAFFHQVRTVLNHRDSLYYEKDKCLRLLGLQDDCKVQLDVVIGNLTGRSVNADLGVEEKDSKIERLETRIEQLDMEAEQFELQLDKYRKLLADKEREIAELRRHVHIS